MNPIPGVPFPFPAGVWHFFPFRELGMAELPPLYQRLVDARDAFADFHSYRSPREALGHSQALIGTVNALIDAFVLGLQSLSNARSPDEAKPLRAQIENVIDAYVLDLTEGVTRLEEYSGDSGLMFYVDALGQAMTGELESFALS